ncbi:DNA polymerase III subunit delta' [Pseudoprimorskyibacter insulae]|uniref:DNA polymerase III subunit tau n=1 Tax=Pseudoprimorskyibacter insulae TaxID=1695997 RepID=A0A2R8ARA8_9RHOB|nr:DNA polymerase III subunit delta' [Pseudoprimorskyibacter insulae]SPF78500.1 DNA polymerase III subunit tau [Pseudoprimorskyibacter insulae]
MSTDDLPQPDRVEGAPHPRETAQLLGQSEAEQTFLQAYASDRLHHGWLIAGPRGVGKATLAWRIARFLLATPLIEDDGLFGAPPPPTTLDIDPEHPVARRMMAGAEPGLFALRRPYDEKTKRLKTQITVEEVRKLKGFFSLSAAEGGRRVVIVDTTDEMNPNAANAILKLLEEPPARSTLLLISHQPSRLLPTIRSRCRMLRLAPLGAEDMAAALAAADCTPDPAQARALAELSGGSVGEAIRINNLDGLRLYSALIDTLGTLPNLDRPRALALAEMTAGRGKEAQFDLLLGLIDVALARLARTGVTGHPPQVQAAPHESTVMARLAPNPQLGRKWAELAQSSGDKLRHGQAVNVDPASLIFDVLKAFSQATA